MIQTFDNPISQMPAFGKNGWLSDAEIKAVIAYLKNYRITKF